MTDNWKYYSPCGQCQELGDDRIEEDNGDVVYLCYECPYYNEEEET